MDAETQSLKDCFPIAFVATSLHPRLIPRPSQFQSSKGFITNIRIAPIPPPQHSQLQSEYYPLDSALALFIQRDLRGLPISDIRCFEEVPNKWKQVRPEGGRWRNSSKSLCYLKSNSTDRCFVINQILVESKDVSQKALENTEPSLSEHTESSICNIFEYAGCLISIYRKPCPKTCIENTNYAFEPQSEVLFQCCSKVPDVQSLSMMCFPEGVRIVRKSAGYRFVNFIITNNQAEQLYCNSIIFTQPCPPELCRLLVNQHQIEQGSFELYHEKSFALLSEYSCTDQMNRCLEHFYQRYLSQEEASFRDRIGNLGRYFTFDRKSLKAQYGGPHFDLSFKVNKSYPTVSHHAIYAVFKFLQVPNILTIVEAMLTENKVYLVSGSNSIIGYAIEAFISFIYPLRWFHLIIPFLSEQSLVLAEAPMAMICGVPAKLISRVREEVKDGVFVFLDENRVQIVGKDSTYIPLQRNLREQIMGRFSILSVYDPIDVRDYLQNPDNLSLFKTREAEDPHFDPMLVRNIFFQLMVFILKDYKDYFNPPTGQPRSSISKEYNFKKLKLHHKNDPFFQHFFQTSLFSVLLDTKLDAPEDKWVRTLDRAIRKISKRNRHFIQEESDNNQTEGEEEADQEQNFPKGCLNIVSLLSRDSGDDNTPRSSPSPKRHSWRRSIESASSDGKSSSKKSIEQEGSTKSDKQTSIGNRVSLENIPELRENNTNVVYEYDSPENQPPPKDGVAYQMCKFFSYPVHKARNSVAAFWSKKKARELKDWMKQKKEEQKRGKQVESQAKVEERGMKQGEREGGNEGEDNRMGCQTQEGLMGGQDKVKSE